MLKETSFIEFARMAKLRHERIKLVEFDADIATEIISPNPPGFYTLPEMHGEYWDMVERERWYGVQFSEALDRGEIKHPVRRVGTKSNNHALYEIY